MSTELRCVFEQAVNLNEKYRTHEIPHDAFFSYCHGEEMTPCVQNLYNRLSASGFKIVIDKKDLHNGEHLTKVLPAKISMSKVFAMFIDEEFNEGFMFENSNQWVVSEAEYAFTYMSFGMCPLVVGTVLDLCPRLGFITGSRIRARLVGPDKESNRVATDADLHLVQDALNSCLANARKGREMIAARLNKQILHCKERFEWFEISNRRRSMFATRRSKESSCELELS